MLSIGKLAVGQAGYYLDQAQTMVSRARAVSSGIEDYYLGGPEARGTWTGTGARLLGLDGTVDAVRLDRVLAGEHPVSGEPLGRVVPRRVPGFDLTFSAPKSVSVLYGVGDDHLRAAIQGAHDRAVGEALGYVDRHAGVTRRGAGGATVIAGRGLVAAAFRHRTSRAGDPQLHTHVLAANVILGSDGRWGTLDGRRIYAHAKAAGYLYELRLRALLSRELGVEWGPVRNGIADVDGVPVGVRRAFSRRRADIEAEMARRGTTTAGAAQVATLATRRTKDYRVSPAQLRPEWRERAAALGLDERAVRELLRRSSERWIGEEDLERLFERLGGPEGLTAERSSFTRRDVVLGLCDGLPVGVDVSVEEIEQLADRFVTSGRAVVLAHRDGSGQSEALGADGRPLAAVPAERRYSTPELLAHERRILEYAIAARYDVGERMPKLAAERAIRSRPNMAEEQREMVRRLLTDSDGVAVVVGQAGTGKTYALAAAAEAWESMGREVFGAVLARRAAIELESGASIPSTSLTALLDQLRRRPLPSRSVLVVDEAGMVPTRVLSQLIEHVERARAKLVLVGDGRQLPEIGAGGAFRALTVRLQVIELSENRRQHESWEREALAVLREGDGDEAIRRYEARGRVVSGEDGDSVRRQLVDDWWRAGDLDGAVMIAHRRRDVADLNGRAHALMRAAGALGPEELAGFATGDRVVMRRNDRRLGVVNGERGQVVAVGGECLRVTLAGRDVMLDPRYVDGGVALGYAITGHLAQGMTCRQTFVLASDGLSREWAYVALSRGRESNRLYVVGGEVGDRAEFAPAAAARPADRVLADALRRSEAQRLALEDDASRIADVQEELASLQLRLEAGQRLVQGPRRRVLFWLREPDRPVMGAGEAQLVANRADALRQELAQTRRRQQMERATPKALEPVDHAAELQQRPRALRRERGFGLER